MQLYQLFNFILIGIFLFSCSEILTGNCSNLYSKRRHYSCYWTEYLIVEEVTLLQLFTKPILAHLPSADSFFEQTQTICLFYLISPRQLELKCCGAVTTGVSTSLTRPSLLTESLNKTKTYLIAFKSVEK